MKPIRRFAPAAVLAVFFLFALPVIAQEISKEQQLLKDLTDKKFDIVKTTIDKDMTLLEVTNPRGSTLLTIAASYGATDLVLYLIGKGANVNAANNYGNTPLHYAAWSSDLVSFKALRDKGAKLDVKNSQGQTPLQYACMGGNPDILGYCIQQGMDIHAKIDDGSSLIHWAAYGGNIGIFEHLESQGMDPGTLDKDGSTPLFWAATGKKPEMVKYLVEKKQSDVNFRDRTGNTPLVAAVQAGSLEITVYLMEKGADLKTDLDKNRTLLIVASESNNPDLIKFLIDRGCEVNVFDDRGSTPLVIAAAHGNLESMKVLIQNGAKTNPGLCARESCTNTGSTALHTAAWRFPSMVKYLAENGADVNAKNLQGNTPMHSACIGDSTQCIEILWKYGGKVNEKNNSGLTPLMLAVQSQKVDAVKTLLACRADPSPADEQGKTALHYAAIAGTGEIMDLLLKNGAKSNVRDKNGHTPSWYAVYYGNDGIAEKLGTDKKDRKSMPDEMAGLAEKELSKGEAVVWYMNHSGWAVRTSNHLLVFDYWQRLPDPDYPCLDNGHINPGEIAGDHVVVFASHGHADHFMQSVFNWSKQVSDIRYIMGFNATVNGDYTYLPAHGEKEIDGVKIRTISSTDSGEGFMVEADGVTIFHPGDHACRYEENDTAFYREIDYLASSFRDIDIAFVPVSGCNFDNKVALEKGNDYVVGKFNPHAVFPMHGSGNEKSFSEYSDRKNKDLKTPIYISAQFRGDRFIIPAREEETVKL